MRTARWTLLVLALVGLAACNGGGEGDGAVEEDNGAAAEGEGEAAGETEISTTATEFAFDPDQWTVPTGEEITLELVNEGSIEHEWVIIEQGAEISSTDEFEEDMVVWEVEADAGETETDTFTAPEPGAYQIVCAVEGHLDAGMEGSLDVVE